MLRACDSDPNALTSVTVHPTLMAPVCREPGVYSPTVAVPYFDVKVELEDIESGFGAMTRLTPSSIRANPYGQPNSQRRTLGGFKHADE